MTEIAATNVPWLPICTIDRSGITEVEVFGIISIVEGTASGEPKSLMKLGDVNYRIWSRSLLKPWQLLSHFDEVVENYPQLNKSHLTLMMSSHSAERMHLQLLDEVMAIGQVSDDLLKCPATYPVSYESRLELKAEGQPPRSLYHTCSGKHFGYLMALKVAGQNLANYTDANAEHFELLKQLLADLTHRPEKDFEFSTTDGCQLPNYCLTPHELASAYLKLACGMKSEIKRSSQLAELGALMRSNPKIIGGAECFDSRLMGGLLADVDEIPIVAKEGVDGLLAIGIGANKKYPHGLGMLIKLSAGSDTRHMLAIVKELFKQLGLLKHTREKSWIGPPVRKDHIKTNFNFAVSVSSAVQ